jgi:hypothetical protein
MRRLLPALLLLAACDTHAYSPPAGGFPIESAATLGAGRRSAGADFSWATAVFGPSVSATRASYRHGLTDQLDVSVEPSLIWIEGATRGDSHHGIYTLRGAVKYAPIRHVSGGFGLGAGASAGGAFLSPDLGLNLAVENPILVPFVSARMYLSAPIAPRYVHFTTGDGAGERPDDSDGQRDAYRRLPHFTYGVQLSGGLRAPFWRNPATKLRPALNCAVGATFLYDRSPEHQVFMGIGCGLDLGF